MGSFTFNGVNSASLNIEALGERTYNLAQRRVTAQNVFGRSGALLADEKAYNNIQQVYRCTLDNSEDADGINKGLDELAALLNTSGYKKLVDSWHPGTFRLGYVASELEIESLRPGSTNGAHRVANFDLSFTCKPQRFLDEGDSFITAPSTLTNPTGFDAYPIIEVSGAGEYSIGEYTFSVLASGAVTIDCETMDAYDGTTNMNSQVTLPLNNIIIPAGATVSISGTMNIKPRWWRL